MASIAALFMGHLNPFTNAHAEIISLLKEEYSVYALPVRFLLDGKEVNTRSFPFSYELRREMIQSVFGNSVTVLPAYTFVAPFRSYLPPILSRKSWTLRRILINAINEKHFVSYTGDRAERLMLHVYRLNPLQAERLSISASSVKDLLYSEALRGKGAANTDWRDMVPKQVASLIERHWSVVEQFASKEDGTKKVLGMKFPLEGYVVK